MVQRAAARALQDKRGGGTEDQPVILCPSMRLQGSLPAGQVQVSRLLERVLDGLPGVTPTAEMWLGEADKGTAPTAPCLPSSTLPTQLTAMPADAVLRILTHATRPWSGWLELEQGGRAGMRERGSPGPAPPLHCGP